MRNGSILLFSPALKGQAYLFIVLTREVGYIDFA